MTSPPPQKLSFVSRLPQGGFRPNVCVSPHAHVPDLLIDNTPYSRFYHIAVTTASGAPQYDLAAIAEPVGAVCLAVTRDRRVALLRHYRPVPATKPGSASFEKPDLPAHGFFSTELPRGFPKPGETHAQAAAREVREELGVGVVATRLAGWCNFNTAIVLTDIPIFVVLVDRDVSVPDRREEAEVIDEVEWCDLDEVRRRVALGNVRCGLTLSALSYAMAGTVLDEVVNGDVHAEG